MEAIQFTPGAQVAGTEVIDLSGAHWTVLKNIGNALAQPREGAYYTRVITPPEPVIGYGLLIQKLREEFTLQIKALSYRVAKIEKNAGVVIAIDFNPHPDDFFVKEEIIDNVKVQRLRIKR